MKKVNILAALMLATMFALLLGSAWNDSAIMDELAHIPAGFGYVTQLDYRLNPEHPPLLKALAAVVAQFVVHPHFPTDTAAWQTDLNGQWDQGTKFLYESGNNADRIIFWSRFPLILLTIFFGWLLFWWTKKRFSESTALLTLAFFAFSPTFLAHGKYVTTDVGAAFGFFVGIIAFIQFLETPSWRNTLIAGAVLGVAELLKFSLILLAPIYGILWIVWVLAIPRLHPHERFKTAAELLGKIIVSAAVAFLVIGGVYAVFTLHYPVERQISDTMRNLEGYRPQTLAAFVVTLAQHSLTRPIGQFFLGILMVSRRASAGNTGYFLGDVSNHGSHWYFPILYLLKEPLALHILTLIALILAIVEIVRARRGSTLPLTAQIRAWVWEHIDIAAAFTVIAVYWTSSIVSPLNIGIRHVLPTFPFMYLLVARNITEWIHIHDLANPQTFFSWLKNAYEVYARALPKIFLVAALMIWLIGSSVAAFPNFMTYYNELADGARGGWRVAVDSNYDWGQDLERLADYMKRFHIERITLDYFGAGNPNYYMGNTVTGWHSSSGQVSGWFAISATFRQNAWGRAIPPLTIKPEDSYAWLKAYAPVARIGSIFLYRLP